MEPDKNHRQPPVLSVIMPAYNAAAFIREAADCVLAQTFKDLELIIADDCSTDSTLSVAYEIAATDSRVNVIAMERNGGPGIARNRALLAARGEFVTFIDADDRIPKDAYSRLVDFARVNKLDIARGAMADFTDKHPEPWKVPPFSETEQIFDNEADLRQMALCTFAYPVRKADKNLNFGGSACSAVFRHEIISRNKLRFDERPHCISEDYLFCYQFLTKARSAGIVPDIVYFYRTNPSSRSHRPAADMIARALQTAESMETMILADGFPQQACEYAYRYAIDIVRAFMKNFFLSDMPENELRLWFSRQQNYPILERCDKYFPTGMLPLTHRLSYHAFRTSNFRLMLSLIRGRELIRRATGR